ncbi:nuclear pore complex protein Nup205 [Emericellopsis cladophorae]|uniref:Nuclear pore complex protein Nup205 n=1 Tax=Emericellopsis cladophorae TaxID=2686198 RepID=A0A9P9XWH4_9HYPO|nr:nuclear pore complex protein Nup205 [Emericellopsis cladophorae]KAI6779020.1 nuclear pore complex protein Nup205 [Emericellopsis cladophorae]
MAELSTLETLQAFHQELLAIQEGRLPAIDTLGNDALVIPFKTELDRIWSLPPNNDQSRKDVQRKVTVDEVEYSINEDFKQSALSLSDELGIDEKLAAQCLLEAQADLATLGRSLLECGMVRFHQQRKYALDALRVLIEMDVDEELDDLAPNMNSETVRSWVAETFSAKPGASRTTQMVPRCMTAMQSIKAWIQKLSDKVSAAQMLGQSGDGGISEELETVEFARISLIQQHELLGVLLCWFIEKRQATTQDLTDFMDSLRKLDKYDNTLVHNIPAVGAFMKAFGSLDGGHDLLQVRPLSERLFPVTDEPPWALSFFQASVRAWWLAEYSSFYLEDPPEAAIPAGIDLDAEDRQRAKQFLDSLKEGAFDFLLSIAGDARSPDWYDSVRAGMHRWLQRKSPTLNAELVQFSDFFQEALVSQLEAFIDSFITNLPDVLRRLRLEEDEQRQLSQAHEQDLDLERFLLIIAYAYDKRPQAAINFWDDPDSNLNGFLQWASRRASTPLVTAFCEMLSAVSGNEECAEYAHNFLLEEGHHSSGKMRRSQSLSWAQIFRELKFFLEKAKNKPAPAQSVRFRASKVAPDVLETEPESAMMLEAYLRLMTRLATENETARLFLLQNTNFNVVEAILELTSAPIPPRLRGCGFTALKALLTRKSTAEGHTMWQCLDQWVTGGYATVLTAHHRQPQSSPKNSMERSFDEMSHGFEDPESLTQLLLALVRPAVDSSPLNDGLPFPENLGSAYRASGIDVYVDFVVGMIFAAKSSELQDVHQIRVLRLCCLDFIMACLDTFNEDLIITANRTNMAVDNIIATADLATYVRLHPFTRVMEWMYNERVIAALYSTVHQEPVDVANAAPDSPLILGILRGVEVISKILDLQVTYLDIVKPLIRSEPRSRPQTIAKSAYPTFEDGLVSRLGLVVDMGNYCGLGHANLTLACLKLMERMSSSSKITSLWSGSVRHNHRNKAVVAMEANGEHESIARAFISELMQPLDPTREAESANYATKVYILDFLYQCLLETSGQPTIAHLLLGFKCGVDSVSIESNSLFEERESLFHVVLRLLLDTPTTDHNGVRQWLVGLRVRALRILQVLWSSPLSASLIIEELRSNELLFHLLLRETVIHPRLLWEGEAADTPYFLVTEGATSLLDLLSLRGMTLDYIAMELCMISQGKTPSVKRRIFEALNGQIMGDENEPIAVPSIFDLFDFHLPPNAWTIQPPPLRIYRDLDLGICSDHGADGTEIWNVERARELILLKRSAMKHAGVVIADSEAKILVEEEQAIEDSMVMTNREVQLASQGLSVLEAWAKLLLVMAECNDFEGAARTQFFLQALQSILPSFEANATERPADAIILAKLSKILLSKLYAPKSPDAHDTTTLAVGNLINDKVYQIFQICIQAIGKWVDSAELRSVYYENCYTYLTGMPDDDGLVKNRTKVVKAIRVYGERLLNVICDDAYNGEPRCQTAALILLGTLVHIDQIEGDAFIVEMLNRLNFIGVLVDSLQNIMQEWHQVFTSGTKEQENFQNARLALIQHLAQARPGAKHILHANLLRTLATSQIFTADPELRVGGSIALEAHYDLLAKTVRIIGAAVVSRGSHNVVQGRKFLVDHRSLVTHALKRSAGIGMEDVSARLQEKVEDLAEALVIMIAATGFLEFEEETVQETRKQSDLLFH